MDSPVSAFAIYKANRPTKPKKNKKKKSPKAAISPKPVPKESAQVMIQIAKKAKRQQEKQKSKNITKKKILKKKKAKKVNDNYTSVENGVNSRLRQDSITISESDEEAPMLIPVKPISEKQCQSDDGSCSHSSGFDFVPVHTNSEEEGLKIFKWMIAPYDPLVFFRKIWEKVPLHISRKKSRYYLDLISTPNIDNMLRNENIQFTKNIDITSYVDGKRETHNPEGRALPRVVWDAYLDGCSIRLLNPQTYLPKLHILNATLQEYFHCFVGANSYLTPPDSQGFAPHYDDIEAFILQVEGKKHWRIYKPLNDYEVLPRVSSKNFDQNEIGEPCMEVTLEAGDMLYFPRGYIHQGVTVDGEHSLHVTISMYQKNSWADLFEKLIPIALEGAINCDVQFREGLPRDIFDHFGFATSDSTPGRNVLEEKIKSLFDKMKDFLQIDPAVDEVAKRFQHDALPPILNDYEKTVTVYGDNDAMIENGKVVNRVEFSLDTRVRLLRKNILRMVCEERTIRLYFYTENSLEYHGNEPTYLEIDDGIASVIETLMNMYPEYVSIENLSDEINDTEKLETMEELWSKGIIMTEYPLQSVDDD